MLCKKMKFVAIMQELSDRYETTNTLPPMARRVFEILENLIKFDEILVSDKLPIEYRQFIGGGWYFIVPLKYPEEELCIGEGEGESFACQATRIPSDQVSDDLMEEIIVSTFEYRLDCAEEFYGALTVIKN